MQWLVDKLADQVNPGLHPGETIVAATPAMVPADPSPTVTAPSATGRAALGAIVLEQRAEPAGLPFAGRMILVGTDHRVVVYERRRWRNRPGRILGSVPLEVLGNVEGQMVSTGGVAELELVFILGDGVASTLRVPAAHAADGREFVRRMQARLLG